MKIRYVCSDMWKPYLNVISARIPRALHVLDRVHIVAKMNKAIDEVCIREAWAIQRQTGQPVPRHSRWCLLKRSGRLGDKQVDQLANLLRHNLRTARAYLLKDYRSVARTHKFV